MKTRTLFLASLSLLAIASFGLATQASVSSSTPGITQTAQWKSLKAYVNSLETKRNTPASPTQKASFRSRLNTKANATNERVKQLYVQSVNALKARDSRKERAAIKKVRESQAQAVRDKKAALASRLAIARVTYNRAVNKINDRFSFRIDSGKRNLKKLRRNLARTTDPFQRELGQQKRIRNNELTDAANYYQGKVKAITLRYDNQIIDTRAYYKALVRKVKSSWKVIYDDDLAAAKSTRTKQFSFVSKLKSRGSGYIDQMPAPPT
jgi:hypothetical protein